MTVDEQQQPLHFLDYWRVVQSRKEIIIAVVLFVVVLGLSVTFVLPKVYRATTRMMVKQASPDVSAFQRREIEVLYDPFFLKTQLEIIQSQQVLDDVIEELELRKQLSEHYGTNLSKADVRKWLLRNIKVRPYHDTNIIEIEVYMKWPEDSAWQYAADIANKISDVYRAKIKQRKRDETREGVDAIQQEYLRQKERVTELEKELETIRQDHGIAMLAGSLRPGGAVSSAEKVRLHQLEQARGIADRPLGRRQ